MVESRMPRWLQGPATVPLVAALILTVFAALALHSMTRKSVTADEIMYVAAGYYHWTTGDFSYNRTNPPLMKLISGLPLLVLRPDLPDPTGDVSEWNQIEQWQYSREFLYENSVDADRILFWSRVPTVVLALILGWSVFLLSRSLYGDRAGLLALFLFALSPNVIAHARLATQDLGVTAFMFWALLALWKVTTGPSVRRLVVAGIAVGAAVVTKTSALVLGPITVLFGLILLARGSRASIWNAIWPVRTIAVHRVRLRSVVSLLVILLGILPVVVLTINLCYGFEGSFNQMARIADPEFVISRLGVGGSILEPVARLALRFPSPFPEPFLKVVGFQVLRVGAGTGSAKYLMGELSNDGWYYLMPLAFLIKTPIPVLILLGAALFTQFRDEPEDVEILVLIAGISVMGLFLFLRSVSVGLRYVLPIYPVIHVLISRLVRTRPPGSRLSGLRTRWGGVALALALLWYGSGTIRLHPHYLASFNEFVGGPSEGYRYLADSFLDWGQDLRGLERYMDDNGIERIRLAYFGGADASYYDIDYEYLPSLGLAPRAPGDRWWYQLDKESLPPLDLSHGPIAVSATLLAGIVFPGYYAELQDWTPVDQVGHSILIFDPDDPGLRR